MVPVVLRKLHKIGVLGFSAGGHLSVAMGVHFEKRLYPAVDAADHVSCRVSLRWLSIQDISRCPRRSGMPSGALESL